MRGLSNANNKYIPSALLMCKFFKFYYFFWDTDLTDWHGLKKRFLFSEAKSLPESVLLPVIFLFFLHDFHLVSPYYAAISISWSVFAEDAAITAFAIRRPLRVNT